MEVPIFPLRRVVLPTERLAVHIFEARYHLMLEETPPAGFGVAWILEGSEVGGGARYSAVGTLVDVVARRDLAPNRTILVLEGRTRFRVETTTDGKPYPTAVVSEAPVRGGERVAALQQLAGHRLSRYMAVRAEAGGTGNISVELPPEPEEASYRVASLLDLSQPERQELLEATLEQRLDRVCVLLDKETELLTKLMRS